MANRFIVVLAVVCALLVSRFAEAAFNDSIGYTSLVQRLTAAGQPIPRAAGIDVTQSEGKVSGNYAPNTANAEFAGKTITLKSGASGVSSHATTVGVWYYGKTTSIAKDAGPIDVYEAFDFLVNFLRDISELPPRQEIRRVQNHSWKATSNNNSQDAIVLQRLDLMIERDGVVVSIPVDNGGGSAVPKLLVSAYNAIAVGRTDGSSSWGPTVIDLAGRAKPDIVVPASLTSYGSPAVGAGAALLLGVMDGAPNLDGLTRTQKALLAKALLMGGATKTEFAAWRKGFATPSTNGTVPLDYRYGAGEMNIDNSHLILTAGQQEASDAGLVNAVGWDVDIVTPATGKRYFFEIPAGPDAEQISILVTWNRKVAFHPPADFNLDGVVDETDVAHYEECATGQGLGPLAPGCANVNLDGDSDADLGDFGLLQLCLGTVDISPSTVCRGTTKAATLVPSLANIDLRLYQATDFTLGTEVDLSISSIDNVEHIYLPTLPAGRYAIELTTDADWPFALTWDVRVPAP